jgi:hypothetical protein
MGEAIESAQAFGERHGSVQCEGLANGVTRKVQVGVEMTRIINGLSPFLAEPGAMASK